MLSQLNHSIWDQTLNWDVANISKFYIKKTVESNFIKLGCKIFVVRDE